MAITHMDTQPPLNTVVAARIRAALALRGMTHADLARALDKPPLWVSRRIGPNNARSVSLNLDEIEQIASILRMPVPVLFGIGEDTSGLLPRMDSNHQPAGNRCHPRTTAHDTATEPASTRPRLHLVA